MKDKFCTLYRKIPSCLGWFSEAKRIFEILTGEKIEAEEEQSVSLNSEV